MIRRHRGIAVTGVEPTLVSLAHTLDGEAFEVACEDARRRRLTSFPTLRRYLERFGVADPTGSRTLKVCSTSIPLPVRSTLGSEDLRRLLIREQDLCDFDT